METAPQIESPDDALDSPLVEVPETQPISEETLEQTQELLRIWKSPEDGAWAFRQQNHHGNTNV